MSRVSLTLAAGCLSVLIAGPASAAVLDGFEAFAGANGANVNGYATWTDFGTTAAKANGATPTVVTGSADAYEGSKYLRLSDPGTTASTTAAARSTFGAGAVSPVGQTVDVSFALRVSASGVQNQVVLYGATTANANVAMQVGIRSTDNRFTYTSYGPSGAIATTSTGVAPVAGRWYLFDIDYTVNSATLAGTYALTITDATTGLPVYANASLPGQSGFSSAANATLSNLVVQTSDSGGGAAGATYSDFDALSITVPEPATIGAVVAGAAVMLRRRRRRA